VTEDWAGSFPDHKLSALASEGSDHAPLLLRTSCNFSTFRRFKFENIWPKYDGYLDTVARAWVCPWNEREVDAFQVLDYKLRNTAKTLTSWSAKRVGSIRLQLYIAKELVLRFD
jgi:hypothetical protein